MTTIEQVQRHFSSLTEVRSKTLLSRNFSRKGISSQTFLISASVYSGDKRLVADTASLFVQPLITPP
jgi:hypothetical protein